MEIKINREIRDYNETAVMGLTRRQCVCGIMLCVTSIGAYFLLRDFLPRDILAWICIFASAPFGVAGFLSYNGMKAEQFAAVLLRFFITPKILKKKEGNLWTEIIE